MKCVGTEAENILGSIIAQPLLLDFVHLRPTHSQSKELCDLLIEDEPIAIPIQLKVQDLQKANKHRSPERWARKQLFKASKQLRGATRRLKIIEISCNSPTRGDTKFKAGDLIPTHGLVILDYSSQPFEIEQTLFRRTKDGVPIHYISHHDFIVLCQELQTLPDLVEYLNQRGNIPAWATPKLNDEKNAYAFYLLNKGKFHSHLRSEDFDGSWTLLTEKYSKKYEEKLQEDDYAIVFGEMLKVLNKELIVVRNKPPFIRNVTKLSNPQRVDVTRKLNQIRRLHRREIVKKLFEKIKKAKDSPLGFNYFAYRTDDPSTMFLFMASRHSRHERLKQLMVICQCVNTITPAKIIIGVATDSLEHPEGRSYDFIRIDERMKLTDSKTIDDCKKLFGDLSYDSIHDFPSDKKRIFESGN